MKENAQLVFVWIFLGGLGFTYPKISIKVNGKIFLIVTMPRLCSVGGCWVKEEKREEKKPTRIACIEPSVI